MKLNLKKLLMTVLIAAGAFALLFLVVCTTTVFSCSVSDSEIREAINTIKTDHKVRDYEIENHKKAFAADKFAEAAAAEVRNYDLNKDYYYLLCYFVSNLERVGCKTEAIRDAFVAKTTEQARKCIAKKNLINFFNGTNQFEASSYYYDPKLLSRLICDALNADDATDDDRFALIKELELQKFHDEDVRKTYRGYQTAPDLSFGSTDEFFAFVDSLRNKTSLSYYSSISEMLPYDVAVAYAKSAGRHLSTSPDSGYYHDRAKDYVNESYWYDVLSDKKVSSPYAGISRESTRYEIFGDFLYREFSSHYYQTKHDDPCNTYYYGIYMLGQTILDKEKPVNDFRMAIKTGSAYVLGSGEKEMVVVVNENELLFLFVDEGQLLSVKY